NSLIEKFNLANKTKDPLVIVIHPSITGADEEKLNAFSQFLNHVKNNNGRIKPLSSITHLTEFITSLEIISAPESVSLGETITITVRFTAEIYCPSYYFRIYGKYPSEKEWRLHAEHYHGVQTGTFTFSKSFTIPEPPADDSSYAIRVVGQGCWGTCWPTPYSYERRDEVEIAVANRPPSKPTLLSPSNNEFVPSITPTLRWVQATDPDGDTITKNQIRIRDEDGNDVLNIEIDAATSYTIPANILTNLKQYSWSVRAFDGKEWGEWSDSWTFTLNYVHEFDLVASIQWDADTETFDEYRGAMLRASNILQDITDNQMRLGTITIYDNGASWCPCDVRIHNRILRENVAWGFCLWPPTLKRYINLGNELWQPRQSYDTYEGGWVIAHEFGHYYLNLPDEYRGTQSLCPGCIMAERYPTELCTAERVTGYPQHTAAAGGDACWDRLHQQWPWIRVPPDPPLIPEAPFIHKEPTVIIHDIDLGSHNSSSMSAEFTGVYSDYGLDTDGDGLYNYLVIEVGVNITNAGNYSIIGTLFDGKGNEITWAGNYAYLDIGSHILWLNFDGMAIRQQGIIQEYYLKDLRLFNADDWNLLDYVSDAYITSTYNYTDFQKPPVELTGNYTDYGVDVDGDGLYDYLTIEVEVNVTSEGNYSLEGQLNDLIHSGVEWEMNSSHLDVGIQRIKLNFDGVTIRKQEINGPYSISNLTLYYESERGLSQFMFNKSYITSEYNYTDFQIPHIAFTGIFLDYGIDTDGDALYDYLTVEVEVNTTAAGSYHIIGWLHDSGGNPITWANNSMYLGPGIHTIPLNFDGLTIYRQKINGPYNIGYIVLRDDDYREIDSLYDAYNTSSYSYKNFERPLAEFTGVYSDYGLDTDGDGLYNYLVIEVGVNITNAGIYSIEGWLYDSDQNYIIWANNSTYLDVGSQLVTLDFDGIIIYRHGVDGPYNLSYIALYDENGTLIDAQTDAYVTFPYNYSDFSSPNAFLSDVYSDYGTDTNGDGLYESLTIDVGVNVVVAGNYTLTGWLYDSDGSEIVQASNYTYLNPGNQLILLNFDGMAIYEHGVNGTYNLSYLTLYDENGTMADYRSYAYTTSPYNYTQFYGGATITGTVIDYNGDPVPDAYILAIGPTTASTITDINGTYRITGLQTGSYTIRVE
ncbi:MAG: hypothetical protein DRN03_04260, partial [Thermoplasmata archaeon]